MKKLCVIGSLNMDLVVTVERFPRPGETIYGKTFGTYSGGKGANQAVAAGRLGADVCMIGKVGDDFYGDTYKQVLNDNGVKNEGVGIEKKVSTGIAVIEVDASGENHIIIVPGANGRVSCEYIDQMPALMQDRDIFLLQLEIPLKTVLYAIKLVKGKGKTLILDPAPAAVLPDEIFGYLDYITPNETEMEMLTGIRISDAEDIRKGAHLLLDKGVPTVVSKAGKNGAYIISAGKFIHVDGFAVKDIDTTAAGDSFNGGFAFALAQGMDIVESVRFANAVGALSTTALGAQGAMPYLEQVEILMREKGIK